MWKFFRNRGGTTTTEYVLIAAMVAVGCLAVFETFAGTSLDAIIQKVSTATATATTKVPTDPSAASPPK